MIVLIALYNISLAIVVVTFLVSLTINLLSEEGILTSIAYAAVSAIAIIPIGVMSAYCWVKDRFTDK